MPHNIRWTRPDEVNQALLDFLNEPAPGHSRQRLVGCRVNPVTTHRRSNSE
jgi:hypothetical protein